MSGEFLSTPSGWRATSGCPILSRKAPNFYPRPPGGGRLDLREPAAAPKIFLSTPSGWRATSTNKSKIFLSKISIHALRVEGDYNISQPDPFLIDFYPRPPGGGRQNHLRVKSACPFISIHALRVEGDITLVFRPTETAPISIHALRVEGDIRAQCHRQNDH